jgi:hypothetical protein
MRRSHHQTPFRAPHKLRVRALRALVLIGAVLALAAGTASARPTPAYDPNAPAAGTTPTVVRIVAPSTGFDWGDAGIGAAAGLAISLVAVGGVLVVSRRRTPPAAPVG